MIKMEYNLYITAKNHKKQFIIMFKQFIVSYLSYEEFDSVLCLRSLLISNVSIYATLPHSAAQW